MRRLVAFALLLATGAVHAQGTGRIQIVHTSPDPALQTLDIYLDDELRPELEGFGFREATPWIEFPAGRAISVVVTRPGSDGQVPYIGTSTVVVEDSVDQYILIDGILQDVDAPQPGIAFRVGRLRLGKGTILFGRDPLDRRTRVGLYNASPDVDGLRFDLFVSANGSGIIGLPLEYARAAGFFTFPAGDFVFRTRGVPEFGDFTVNATQIASNGDGDTVLLFFSGYTDSVASGLPALGLHAVTGDGTVRDLVPIAIPTAPSAPSLASRVRVAPNPVRGPASVLVEQDVPGSVSVEVRDALGRVVWRSQETALAAGATRLPLPTDGLAPGAYAVSLVGVDRATVQTGMFTVVR